ncbi:tail assembly protein [Mesorhizobium sp.]|uniref:tail assembly protein n=1 Tax=Mesorhizobium sp. TaxID=1871066 RepID=UPI000FE2A5B3|nr:tail assembly protein [Mesorhizobium sp.]RWI35430.1 MAG: tail assembly protein [Mesorhizobium sp.]RWJ03528.1 MAG: tail assembly protein [Mesorhizobium sp.]RWJ66401.1 MAG: tail assembly protein [Mesorhizobium sp.]
MLRKIHLHGHLKQFGDVIELDVATAAEAVRALGVCIPGFLNVLREGAYHVVRGSIEKGFSLGEDDLLPLKLGRGDLHIMPMVIGGKRGGILKTILGTVLVGAALFLSGGALGTAVFAGVGITWGNVAMVGLVAALSGVSQLLAPSEKGNKDDASFTTSGPGNTYDQGGAIQLVYGETITGSVLVSGGVDIEKIKGPA